MNHPLLEFCLGESDDNDDHHLLTEQEWLQCYTRSPIFALSIWQLLPRHTQTVLCWLFACDEDQPFPLSHIQKALIQSAGNSLSPSEHKKNWKLLTKTQMIQTVPLANGKQGAWMPKSVRNSLRAAFCIMEKSKGNVFSKEGLTRFAAVQWDAMLRALVTAATGGTTTANDALRRLLVAGGLLKESNITRKGFRFLLQDRRDQLWQLVLVYIRTLPVSVVLSLSWIVQLAYAKTGQAYQPENEQHASCLKGLVILGLVKFTEHGYFTTDLVQLLQPTHVISSSWVEGHILVETSFRVYAYIQSPLQVALLSMFVDLQTRFRNMAFGRLTQSSVRRALERGMSASQMIDYLTTHAHPQAKQQRYVIPPTVCDQLLLWEKETMRLHCDEAILYSSFNSPKQFQEALSFAEQNEWLLWSSFERDLMVVKEVGRETMKQFIKQLS